MATTESLVWCHTIGDVLERMRQTFVGLTLAYESGFPFPTITLTEKFGYRAVKYHSVFEDEPVNRDGYLIVNSMGFEDRIPMLSLARQAGFSGGSVVPFNLGDDHGYQHFANSVAMWHLYLTPWKSAIVADWSYVDEIFTDEREISYASDRQKMVIQNTTVQTSSGLIPVYETLRGQAYPPAQFGTPEAISVETFSPDGVVVQASNGLGQAIVEAIQALGLVDTEISFNNGATVYSIKSRSVTSP